jgi:protein-tyrosine phosphatase
VLDVHNHVLYGLDDGCRTLEESRALADRAKALGHVGFVATPHIRAGMFDNTVEGIRARRSEVEPIVRAAGLELYLGAEYYFDEALVAAAKQKSLLTLGETSRYVLTELPQAQLPLGYDQVLFGLRTQGYVPIIAHPERCKGVQRDLDRVVESLLRCAILQLDLGSLVGHYGGDAQKAAHAIVKKGSYRLAAGDLHRPEDADAIIPKAKKELARLLKKSGPSPEVWLLDNPRRVVANLAPETLDAP